MEKTMSKPVLENTISTKKPQENSVEISIKEFLDFLRTAYQVTDTVEETLANVEGASEVVNWIKLKNTELVQPKSLGSQTSQINLAYEPDNPIKGKLDDVLNDGLLDSVLPYLVPNSNKKSSTSIREKGSTSSTKYSSSSKESLNRRKSTDNNSVKNINRTESKRCNFYTVNNIDLYYAAIDSSWFFDPIYQFLFKTVEWFWHKNKFVKCSQQTKHASCAGSGFLTALDIKNHNSETVKGIELYYAAIDLGGFKLYVSEIEIHVCDEVKNVKKDFICSQKLLVEKMGYFAEVTSGQKLEDMDISVHCDIGIFEWLMSWVKQDAVPEPDRPKLDTSCVVPILVSAAFLQMEPLLNDCLLFCHQNLNEILHTATNLSCLNDNIITRLAAMYTNSELELIKDKKDKIQSRLYCKMIQSLCDPVSESVRGHWNSLARVFKCSKCEQLIMPEISKILPCHPTSMTLNRHGLLISNHVRDPTWNINDYILSLHQRLKNWRKVYWYLWGDAHFLFCSHCQRPFPAHKLKWCQYHPEPPQYFTVDSQKSPLPVGRFPCCGERAYKFQLLTSYSGCKFKEHIPRKVKPRDAAVYAILEKFRDVIDVEPPELIFPERLTRLVARDASTTDGKLVCKEEFWWSGLQILPPRNPTGLLGFNLTKTQTPSPTFEEDSEEVYSSSSRSSSSSSCDHSEESCAKSPKRVPKKRQKKKKKIGKLWQMNLSARSNQDLQRSNEEQMLSKMVKYLSQKSSNPEGQSKFKGYMKHVTPPGGIYSRLEAEWKELNVQSGVKKVIHNRNKIRATRLT